MFQTYPLRCAISLALGSIILFGCHSSDNETQAQTEVQAFDGPIWKLPATFNCGDGDIAAGTTDFNGKVRITTEPFASNPENCSVTFGPATDPANPPIDTSNGKDVSNIVLKAPAGLFQAGQPATASPITTLLANALGSTPYNDSAASTLLQDLGIDEALNQSGLSVQDFLRDTENAIETIKSSAPTQASKVIAMTHALTDTLRIAPTGATADQITQAAVNITAVVLRDFPNYPDDNNGSQSYFDVTSALLSPTAPGRTIFNDISEKAWTADELQAVGGVRVVRATEVTCPVDLDANGNCNTQPEIPDVDIPTGDLGGTGGTGGTGSSGAGDSGGGTGR